MKKMMLLVATTMFTGLISVAHGSDASLSKRLLGGWECSYETSEEGIRMKAKSKDYYVRNGKSNSFGELTITYPAQGYSLEYFVATTGEWEISNGFLIETLTDIKTTSVDPIVDELLNLQEMIPTGLSESSKIVTLSEKSLVVISESNGTEISCSRIE